MSWPSKRRRARVARSRPAPPRSTRSVVTERSKAEERLRAGTSWDDQGLIFTTAIGTPLDAGALLRRTHYQLLKRAGLPRVNFHALRYTAATLLLAAGTHSRVVAERLGHTTPSVTLSVYRHVTPTMQREATATLDAVLRA